MNNTKRNLLALVGLLASTLAHAQSYNRFQPANGVLKGSTSTYATTPATWEDIVDMWGGTCDADTLLAGDGTCVSGGSFDYPQTALELAASITPYTTHYPEGDPRRSPLFYSSNGWSDFRATPGYVNATTYTYAGDWTALFVPHSRIRIVGASGFAEVMVRGSTYSAPNTVITIANDTGDTLPTSPLAIWLQTGLSSSSPSWVTFNRNAILGMAVTNRANGSNTAARYCAFATDSGGTADAAVCMVAVSPSYSGAYLGSGYTSGGRSVLYSPPGTSLEIGSGDQAVLKMPNNGTSLNVLVPSYFPDGSASTPSIALADDPGTGLHSIGAGDIRMGTSTVARQVWTDTVTEIRTPLSMTVAGSASAPAVGFSGLDSDTGDYLPSTNCLGRATDGVLRFTTCLGVFMNGATGGDQGAGTINATAVYDDGVLLANQVGANPSGTIGLTAVNGSAGTFLRSDGAPALSQSIAPTWTAVHTYSARPVLNDGLTVNDTGRSVASLTDTAQVWGNTTDNPTYTWAGTGLATHGGNLHIDRASGSPRLQLNTAGTRRAYLHTATGTNDFCNGTVANDLCVATASGKIAFSDDDGGSVAFTVDGTGVLAGSPTGGGQGAGTINATGLFINGVPVSGGETTTGSFTGTLTGMTTSPGCSMKYRKTGTMVFLYNTANCTGTSNANTFTMTGLPAAIVPTRTVTCLAVGMQDNGTVTVGAADINSGSSTVNMLRQQVSGANIVTGGSLWTASGTKGITSVWTCIYDLDS